MPLGEEPSELECAVSLARESLLKVQGICFNKQYAY
jgi:hypothetical protein